MRNFFAFLLTTISFAISLNSCCKKQDVGVSESTLNPVLIEADSFYEIGFELLKTQNFDSSIIYFQLAESNYKIALGIDSFQTLLSRFMQAEVFNQSGKYDSTKIICEGLEAYLWKENPKSSLLDSLIELHSTSLYEQRKLEECEKYVFDFITKCDTNKTSFRLGKAYEALGITYQYWHKYQLANDFLKKSLFCLNKNLDQNHKDLIMVLTTLGLTFQGLAQHDSAICYVNLAIERIDSSLRPNSEYAYAHFVLTQTYRHLGNYSDALKSAEIALEEAKKIFGPYNIMTAHYYRNISIVVDRATGDFELTRAYLEKALNIYKEELGANHFLVGWVYNAIGATYSSELNYLKTKKYYELAFNIANKNQKKISKSTFDYYRNLAAVKIDLKEYLSSEQMLLDLLDEEQKTKGYDSTYLARTYGFLAKAQSKLSKHDLAIFNAKKAIQLMQTKYGLHHPLLNDQRLIYATVLANKGDLDSAVEIIDSVLNDCNVYAESVGINPQSFLWYREMIYLQIKASLYKNYPLDSFTNQRLSIYDKIIKLKDENRYFLHDGYSDVKSQELVVNAANDGLKTLLRQADSTIFEKAFYYAEKSKAAQLMSNSKRNALESFLPEQFQRREQKLRVEISKLESELMKPDSNTAKEFIDKKIELSMFLDSIRESFPHYYEQRYDIKIRGIDELQKSLEKEIAFLEYVVVDNLLWVFKIEKSSVNLISLGSIIPIEENILNFRKQSHFLNNSTSSQAIELVRLARELYSMLIEPLGKLPNKIIIIPDGSLSQLAFETLLSKEVKNAELFATLPYLINDKEISYSFSANWWLHMKDWEKNGSGIVSFAPIFNESPKAIAALQRDSISPLQYNTHEVQMLNGQLNGELFIGELARLDQFKRATEENKVIHIASHAKTEPTNPAISWIAFQNNDYSVKFEKLFLKDIYALNLKAELVTLSACETGVGEFRQGEGAISLAHGFASAGAKSIVQSLWSVNDQSTATIMGSFYKYLADGQTKSAALRQAKLDYIAQSDHAGAHPFYWAAFVPMGDMSPLSPDTDYVLWWVLAGLALMLGVYFYILNNE